MPPKKLTGEKKKIVEDKTFGLKNKNKSAKVGRYVETVKNQAMHAGQSRKDMVNRRFLLQRFRLAGVDVMECCVHQRHQTGDDDCEANHSLYCLYDELLGFRHPFLTPEHTIGIISCSVSNLQPHPPSSLDKPRPDSDKPSSRPLLWIINRL